MEGQRSVSLAPAAGVVVAFPRRAGFEPWLTKKQVAAHYGYSVRWVELRVRDGMPSHRRGGQLRFLLSEVEAWFEGRRL